MRAEENVRRGMAADEAEREARRRFGNLAAIRDGCLDFAGGGLLESIWQDVRFGARSLARRPGFGLVAVLTLALGVGANTAAFSVVNAALLRPLPYPNADRLVQAYWTWSKGEGQNVSAIVYQYWSEHSAVFESTAGLGYAGAGFNLEGGGEPLRATGLLVSEGFFRTLGVSPAVGRGFTLEEDRPNGPRAAVITDGLWRRAFGADRGVVGRTVRINGSACEVVGVMPPGFEFEQQADVLLPLALEVNPRDTSSNSVMLARLKPGVTVAEAKADSDRVFEEFRRDYPSYDVSGSRGVHFVPYQEAVVGDVGTVLLLMLGAAGMVLLVACANVASLLLARATARGGEMAVRSALGAGGWRLARQVLTESVLLAAAGTVAALVLAAYGVPALLSLRPDGLPSLDRVGLDWRVVAFASAAGLMTSLLFGAAPALHARRFELADTLRSGRAVAGTGAAARLRSVLAAGEVALSFVLLVGAALLVESLVRLEAVDLGFRPGGLTTMQLSLNSSRYTTSESTAAFERQVIERLEAIPGVASAAAVPGMPLERGLNNFATAPDRPEFRGLSVESRAISSRYFETLGVPLVRGRALTDADGGSSARTVVVNETFARRFWPDADPVGRTVKIDGAVRDVVGVAGDVREGSLDTPALPTIYMPAAQVSDGMTAATNEWFMTTFMVRTSGGPPPTQALRAAVRDVDASLPVASVRRMSEVVRGSVAANRFVTALLAAFAATAILLTAVGLYGLVSYKVAMRTREIGVRVALGAEPRSLVALVVRDGLGFTLAGLAAGLVAALALGRLVSGFLFGVTATDPRTYAIVAGGLLAVAVAACVVPALRATRVSPLTALRSE
jgi:predicted permease